MQSILNVVRGTEPWTVLKKLGVYRNRDTWHFEPYSTPVLITADDLIAGFRSHSSNQSALREWAAFVLAASNLISFNALEEDMRGECLLDELWRAAFGEEIYSSPPGAELSSVTKTKN